MGFFKTTKDDIEKYKYKGNVGKIIAALTNKDVQVALYAFSTLGELSKINDSIKEILDKLIEGENSEIECALREYIEVNPELVDRILNLIVGELSDENYEYKDLKSEIDIRISNYKKYIDKYASKKTPYLIELLDNKNIYVRIFSAGMLQAINEKSSYDRWKGIIDNEQFVVNKNLKFKWHEFPDYLMGGIPLYEIINCEVVKSKLNSTSSYVLGMTDENILIVPGIMPPGTQGNFYLLDIRDEVECIIKNDYDFSIHCKHPQYDPRILADATNILNFQLSKSDICCKEYASRLSNIIELIDVLKNERYSKREIYEKYYNVNNLGFPNAPF